MSRATLIEVEGRRIALTELGTVVYPETGTTKWDVVDYYTQAAPAMIPHLRGKAIVLRRHIDGAAHPPLEESFLPEERPEWIRPCIVTDELTGRTREYCLVDDVSSLLWLLNLGVIEIASLQAFCVDPEYPTTLMFRLEPTAPAVLFDCIEGARLMREILRAVDLECCVMTDGSGGLYVMVPIDGTAPTEEVSTFAHAVSILLHREHPGLLTSTQRRDLRAGQVFIDWSVNGHRVASTAPYSMRAGSRPMIATPLAWEELDAVRTRHDLPIFEFSPEDMLRRIASFGDILGGMYVYARPLPRIM